MRQITLSLCKREYFCSGNDCSRKPGYKRIAIPLGRAPGGKIANDTARNTSVYFENPGSYVISVTK
jgi:hypothetical protein